MILKKPYAMLIKNFRTIHIILTLLTIFIAYKSHTVISFFRSYINNNYSVSVIDNLASNTISPWLFVAIILAIGILVTIYILLKTKKKPNKTYFISIIYYIILLIFLFIAWILINSLSKGLWDAASARTYRDFAGLIYYPQFILIIIMGLRSFGFNIKQFNFKSDLKELEITDKDSEEIELNLNFQTFKVERMFRRFFREFKYYYLENKFIFFIIGIVLVLVIGYFIITKSEKTKYNYKENQSLTYNGLNLTISESMITNLDLKGNVVEDGKYYVVIKFNVKNSSNADKYLDYNNFKLYYGNQYLYPSLESGNYFLDFGNPYMNNKLYSGNTYNFIMAYKIDEKYKNSNFKLVLYIGTSTKSQNKFLSKTATIKLKPKKYENVDIVSTAEINQNISFSSSLIKDSNLSINSVLFSNRYEYNYQNCYKNSCRTYTDVVVADASYLNRQALIVMDYNLSLDESASSYQNINDINSFVNNFMEVEYVLNDTRIKSSVKYVTPAKLKDKIVLQTSGDVLKADEVNLLITIRNRCYLVKLK